MPSASTFARQIVAVDELHHDRGDVRIALEAVDVRDVGMIQRCKDRGLALESRKLLAVGGDKRR